MQGPAAAAVISARRVSCELVSATTFCDHKGVHHDLLQTPPGRVICLIEAAVRAWRWDRVIAALPLEGHPSWRPVFSLMQGKGIRPAAAASLRTLVAGRQWLQQRLRKAGLTTTPWCQLCLLRGEGNPPSPAQGTVWHRAWGLPCGAGPDRAA